MASFNCLATAGSLRTTSVRGASLAGRACDLLDLAGNGIEPLVISATSGLPGSAAPTVDQGLTKVRRAKYQWWN